MNKLWLPSRHTQWCSKNSSSNRQNSKSFTSGKQLQPELRFFFFLFVSFREFCKCYNLQLIAIAMLLPTFLLPSLGKVQHQQQVFLHAHDTGEKPVAANATYKRLESCKSRVVCLKLSHCSNRALALFKIF